jgi:hypothetical protein
MKTIGSVLCRVGACVCVAIVVGLGTMLLWNWLIPQIFNGPEINFIETLGLLVLSKIFFGFNRMAGGNCSCGKRAGGSFWKERFSNRFSAMTPEQKEVYKQKLKEKWCSSEPTDGHPNSNV